MKVELLETAQPRIALGETPAGPTFWWQFSSAYYDLPFYTEFGLSELPGRDDALAAREQLWALREDVDDLAQAENKPGGSN